MLWFLVFLLTLLSVIEGQYRNLPQYEIDALQDLYDSTNGDEWIWYNNQPQSTHWNFSSEYINPCINQWQGITCMNSTDDESLAFVYEIDLGASSDYAEFTMFNLSGTLPSSIGNFSEMAFCLLNFNSIHGSIPSEVCKLQNLFSIDLGHNLLSGTIPSCLYTLPYLAYLKMFNNTLSGSIDNSIGNMTNLVALRLDQNKLTGTLPVSLSNCTSLVGVVLRENLFNGTIPSEYGKLNKLNLFAVNHNKLTGSLPDELFEMCNPQFQAFLVDYNLLTGTLPYSMNNCSYMSNLYLDNNKFHGTIPNYEFPMLQYMYMQDNRLTGTIPSSFSMSQMKRLDLSNNNLHGSIPQYLFSRQMNGIDLSNNQFSGSLALDSVNIAVNDLILGNNSLTGTIPAIFVAENVNVDLGYNYFEGTIPNLSNMTSVMYFTVNNNLLYGSIPSIANLISLISINLASNQLTGSLPDKFSFNLEGFEMDDNDLQGTVPPAVFSNGNLRYLNIGSNYLTGSITSISALQKAVDFNVYENYFTGLLPYELSMLPSIEGIFLDNNMLSGELDQIFNAGIQIGLKFVDVSNNQIHGTIPIAPFLNPSLTTFSAVSNCLYGTIPEEICTLGNLTTLAMDGLESASVCQYIYIPDIPMLNEAYGVWKTVSGLHSCLFNMTALQTLHLSGNAISGSIPKDVVVSDSLQDLSLSHNSLTGTIPLSIQLRPWMNLDLSYNKLGGGLSHSMPEVANNASVSLEVNRLSGDIPHSLKNAKTIDLLDGNLFKCDTDRRQLPVHDKYSDIYECGSNTFNYSLYVWMALCFLVVTAIVVVLNYVDLSDENNKSSLAQLCRNMDRWLSVFTQEEDRNFTDGNFLLFADFVQSIRTTYGLLTIFILLVLMPIYIALSFESNTYAYEYAWTVSAAYLSGLTPAIVLIVCFTVLGVLSICVFLKYVKFNRLLKAPSMLRTCPVILMCSFITVVIINVVLVTTVNIGYVYVHVSYDATIVHFAQFALAMFKLLWNNWAVRELLKLTKRFDGVNNELSSLLSSRQSKFGRQRVGLEVLMILFNNLGAPFIATALVSTNCFYNIIAAPPKVEVSYTYAACIDSFYYINGSTCLSYDNAQVVSTSYSPPFLYSYQCASTFITTYSSIYMFMFIISAFLAPMGFALMYGWYRSTVNYPTLHALVGSTMPKILKVASTHNNVLMRTPQPSITVENPSRESLLNSNDSVVNVFEYHVVFHCDLFVVKVINIFAMIVTFGAVLPPLAVVGFVAVFSFTLYTQLLIGRYVMKAADGPDRNRVIESMNRDCEHASDMFMNAVWIVLPFAMVFYAILLLDTLGDAVGWKKALWAPVVTLVAPFGVWLVWKFGTTFYSKNKRKQQKDSFYADEQPQNSLTENLLPVSVGIVGKL